MTRTVLIIDDDDILRKTLAHGLRADGFHAILASSAQHGDQILKRITVDAIILDRMMAGTDGLTFLRELRQSGNQTPVIMLTAMGGRKTQFRVYRVVRMTIWLNHFRYASWYCV